MLTNKGAQLTSGRQDVYDSQLIFDRVCDAHDINHQLTNVNRPWTNGPVDRMSHTIKNAWSNATTIIAITTIRFERACSCPQMSTITRSLKP